MKSSYLKFLFAGVTALMLYGCSGGDSNNTTSSITVTPPTGTAPPSDTVTPPTGTAPPSDYEPVVVSGVAASGAALDGALIEVIDASGNVVDVGDALTGSDGSYQVSLPEGVTLPVIVRVTPPGHC